VVELMLELLQAGRRLQERRDDQNINSEQDTKREKNEGNREECSEKLTRFCLLLLFCFSDLVLLFLLVPLLLIWRKCWIGGNVFREEDRGSGCDDQTKHKKERTLHENHNT
jgi:hypothetical protein